MDWESKEPPSFKIPRLEPEIAAMEKEKGVGGGEEIKLGFEPTIVGYIYSLRTYRKFRRKVGSSDEFKKILPRAFLRRKHGTSDGGVGTSDTPSEVPMKDF